MADEQVRARIEAAHDEAVRRALDEMQKRAIVTRRGRGGAREERAEMVAAVFRHGTSREQDPQLHSHAFILNTARRSDGTWGTIESRNIYQYQKALGAIYRAELAHRLRELGYHIERDGDAFRIASVPRNLERDFSTRRRQIEAALAERGTSGAAASEAATLDTRRAKKIVDPAHLRERWAEVAAEYDYTAEQARPAPSPAPALDVDDGAELVEQATEHRATLREQDLIYQAAVAAQGARNADDALDLAEEMKDSAVRLQDRDGSIVYTSQSLVDAERAVMAIARDGRDDTRHRLDAGEVDAAIRRVAEKSGYPLTDEQSAAVQYLTRQTGRVGVLIGDAGTGKSTSMEAVREAYEQAGFSVVGCAPSGKAAAGLEESTGIHSYTIDALLGRIHGGSLTLNERSVVVLDETGMVDSRKMASLLREVERAGAKAVLCGDPKQLQPVAAGAVLRHLADDRRGVGHARIEQVFRQRDADHREAVAAMSRGEAARAMGWYIDQGRVSVAQTHKKAVKEVARKYLDARDEVGEKKALALASTNARVRDINEEVRRSLKQRGELQDARTFDAMREIERDKKTGELITETEQCEYAAGDRIIYAGSNDYEVDLRRGDLGTVISVADDKIRVRLDRDGREIDIDPAERDVRHGYALTTHRAQGATVERCVIYASADTSREMAYVQASRARAATDWITTRHTVQQLAERAEPTASMREYAENIERMRRDRGETEADMAQVLGSFAACRSYLDQHASYRIGVDPDRDDRLAEFRDVINAMSESRQAESTLDYEIDHGHEHSNDHDHDDFELSTDHENELDYDLALEYERDRDRDDDDLAR